MAFGDVRFTSVIGLYLGWLGPRYVFLGFFVAFLTASVVGIALIIAKRADRRSPIPFGVFLALGALITIFTGHPILRWYLG